MTRSRPTLDRRDTWHISQHAQQIAAELSLLIYGRRLISVDPRTRSELMQAAEACVTRAIEDHLPDEDTGAPDAMQAHRDRGEMSA